VLQSLCAAKQRVPCCALLLPLPLLKLLNAATSIVHDEALKDEQHLALLNSQPADRASTRCIFWFGFSDLGGDQCL
jgi:hypothetical protein